MGALFSTQDNLIIHHAQGFAKGTGKILGRVGKKIVHRGVRDSIRTGYISKGIDRTGDLIHKGISKTANFAREVTQKGRIMFRKKNNKQNKNTNIELLPATANENVAVRANSKKNAAAQSNRNNNEVSTEVNNTTVAANNAAANNAAAKKAAANNAAAKKAAANNAAAKKASISPTSSDLTQTTVSNTANNKPIVKSNSVKNSGSTVQNTSLTKAANNEMYSSILTNLEGLKEDMEKKVDEEFKNRISRSKPGSKIVTISQIGGPNFTRLIKLFLIIQKLRNNNNNTKKLELELKELLESRVIDKKSKKSKNSEDLLKEYKTKISQETIDMLKREFNDESKDLFKQYTEIDEKKIPQINSPNNNARSNANTMVSNSNQSNLTEELKNLNSKYNTLPLLDKPQSAVTFGGSLKKSKKSRS
jgi:hypothetical protein